MNLEKPDYEKPVVVDYGELTKLTAGTKFGSNTDMAFPAHTPKNKLTFS